MKLQHVIKIFGSVSAAAMLMAGLSACSNMANNPNGTAGNTANQPSASFASTALCTNNPFLQKYQCSFSRVEQAARSGDPDAQYALGYLYYYGIGATQDRQTGLMWIRKAAAQGQPVAQQALQKLSGAPAAARNGASTSNSSNSVSSANAGPSSSNATKAQAQPDRPLSDYLPNYGEKRVDTTTATPPTVNLSTPPASANQ